MALLLTAVALLLAVATVNVGTLLLMRTTRRETDLGVRAALGASSTRLRRELLVEALVLGCAGAFFGIVLSWIADDLVRAVAPPEVAGNHWIGIDVRIIAMVLIVTLVACTLAALLGASRLNAANLGALLNRSGRSMAVPSSRTLRGLVVLELAASVCLSTVAVIALDRVRQLYDVRPGFVASGVTAFELDLSHLDSAAAQQRVLGGLERALAAMPGVAAMGAADQLPLTQAASPRLWFATQGNTTFDRVSGFAHVKHVDRGYFDTLQIPLVRGRLFNGPASETEAVVLVSEAAWNRFFSGTSLRDARITFDSEWYKVIGVVADAKENSLDAEAEPQFYVPYWKPPLRRSTAMSLIVRRVSGATVSQRALATRIASTEPALGEPRAILLEDIVASSSAFLRFRAQMFFLLLTAALIIAAIGVYAVVGYEAAGRRKEIAVRMALGARPREAALKTLNRGFTLASVGAVVGLAMLGAGVTVRQDYLSVSASLIAASASCSVIIMGLVALAATVVPALRATRVDPADSLLDS